MILREEIKKEDAAKLQRRGIIDKQINNLLNYCKNILETL